MSNSFNPPKGMYDIASPEVETWQRIERIGREVMACYNYGEVRTPVMEMAGVFTRSLGEVTDIVQKEMYAFKDRGDRLLALRPEGTASVMRYVMGKGQDAQQARLYYVGPMFRGENVQRGRQRQFHQIGVEAIGEPNPLLDVEVLMLQRALLEAWGVGDVTFQINTIGSIEERPAMLDALRAALEPQAESLCADCQQRIKSNVLRVLDCKQRECSKIIEQLPPVASFLSEESQAYFATLQEKLTELGLPYEVNPRLVRGFDYYMHTVWEVTAAELGNKSLSGGGRYRFTMDKKSVEGVGFAIGLERIMIALEEAAKKSPPEEARKALVWLVAHDEASFEANLRLLYDLRASGIAAAMDSKLRNMKAQMKAADRNAASHVLIRGAAELAAQSVQLKNLVDGSQEEVPLADVPETMKALQKN